ncbi:hypothetical protein [Clostridium beijerinckii]|uniref:hypothetical protein n=1 Tax=Clostridium beijerinckii TaxID=1520 RepID=UPI0014944AEF|nr:hypothetical protein [Clostridium beijerinckii]NOW03274.1 hypothetical protein [Clostridium beijerinckii]NRT70823.1 hypothetical protein [Clostridium beijerinckii]NYC03584.1 hypothetical protein [Clostridium beijerinckii]
MGNVSGNRYNDKLTRFILSCIAITSVFFTNFIAAKATIGNSIYEVSSNNINMIREQHKFIIDAPIKFYNDIKRLEQVIDFKFKVPDFFPEGYKVQELQLKRISDKDNVLEIVYGNKDGIRSLQISEQDPSESLKVIENGKSKALENSQVEISKQPMKVGDINGLSVILTTTFPVKNAMENQLSEIKAVNNYFSWKDDGLWYSVEYKSESKSERSSNNSLELSSDDIKNIVKSLKYPEDTKDLNYCIKNLNGGDVEMNIYDRDDIEEAKNALEFDPKFPIRINNNISITNSTARLVGDLNNNKEKACYEINNLYSNKNGSITFTQTANSSVYDEMMKNKYIKINKEGNVEKKIQELRIENNQVFKRSQEGIVPQVNYVWKENNIYYSIIFFVNIENCDEIVKEFMNSKPLE